METPGITYQKFHLSALLENTGGVLNIPKISFSRIPSYFIVFSKKKNYSTKTIWDLVIYK